MNKNKEWIFDSILISLILTLVIILLWFLIFFLGPYLLLFYLSFFFIPSQTATFIFSENNHEKEALFGAFVSGVASILFFGIPGYLSGALMYLLTTEIFQDFYFSFVDLIWEILNFTNPFLDLRTPNFPLNPGKVRLVFWIGFVVITPCFYFFLYQDWKERAETERKEKQKKKEEQDRILKKYNEEWETQKAQERKIREEQQREEQEDREKREKESSDPDPWDSGFL